MLRDLTIQNYRCFKDFHIDGLARVNLLVGMNNIGKTSLLEAVYLFVNRGAPQCLADLLNNRGEFVEQFKDYNPMTGESTRHINYAAEHIFYDHQATLEKIICFKSTTESYPALRIYLQHSNLQDSFVQNLSETETNSLGLVFESEANKVIISINDDGLIESRWFKAFRLPSKLVNFFPKSSQFITNRSLFLTTNNLNFEQLDALWSGITLTTKEDKVIDALRILEPSLERISFTSPATFNRGILVRLRDQYPIPLGSMGEGMRRILNLAIAAVTVENGFLLVDEIESGLYYETQTDMWRFILEVAQKLNIQVFATTHSWDCISAFQEALDQLEDRSVGKLFRLSRKGENIRAVDYPAEKLGVAVRQSIEVLDAKSTKTA